MTDYFGLLRKDTDSDFGVSFPDFPGCVTAGRTLDEAQRMAREALEFHIKGMVEDGDPVPEPSSLDAIMKDPDNRDGVVIIVSVAPNPARSMRINVMLPADIVAAIDRITRNRSRWLADAAKAKLLESAS